MVHQIWSDVRFALRLLGKQQSFTLITIAVLGAGIGVANMNFVLVNAFCLRGLPIVAADRVVFIGARDARDRDTPNSIVELDALRTATHVLGNIAAYSNASFVVSDEGRAPDRVAGNYVSAATFRVLAERPALGRDFQASDEMPGAPSVAILSDRLWRATYEGDAGVIGRTIRVNGKPATVIAVMGPGFRFPSNTDVWLPLAGTPDRDDTGVAARALSIIGRLPDGVTLTTVRAELAAMSSRLSREYPESNRDTRLTAVPINERFNARITEPTWLAFIGVGAIVLLIACANAANLLLMRAVDRGHEMAVRASLGASRRRLIQQLVAESGLLAVFGALAGTAASLIGVRLVTSMIPANTLGYFTRFTMDGRVFGVLVAAVVTTVLVFGLAPALQASRSNLSDLVRDGIRASGGARQRRLTTAFLTAEFGLTMVLLAALSLGVRVARATGRLETTVDASNGSTGALTLPANRYPSAAQRLAFYQDLEGRLQAIPGVSTAAVTTALPLSGAVSRNLVVDGRTRPDGSPEVVAWTLLVTPRYFDALGVGLLSGRAFDVRDGGAGNEAAIVNRQLADLLFPDGNTIGRRISLGDPAKSAEPPKWLTIVGVSPTVRQRTLAEPDPVVYLPLRSAPPTAASVIVRADVPGAARVALMREAVFAVDPELPLGRARSMEQALLDAQWNARVARTLINIMAFVAILLAAIGLYGVTTHAVLQRRHEIGIRMALGARGRIIAASVARRAVFQLALGIAAGVAITWGFERIVGLGGDAFGFRLSDPLTLGGAAMLLAVLSAFGSAGPAYRASRLQPLQVLRSD